MKNNFINVDGKETGYVALDEQGQIIHFKSGTVFLNKNILNAVLERNNVTRFSYGLLVEGKLVPMSEVDETSEEFMSCRYITDDTLNHPLGEPPAAEIRRETRAHVRRGGLTHAESGPGFLRQRARIRRGE